MSNMKLRTKLLLYFLTLSTLIIIVGFIFYVQLKNLIEPLSPESIPQNVEQLGNSIDRNDFIYQLLQKQLLTQRSLEHYVFTQQRIELQRYYLNQALLFQYLKKAEKNYPDLWNILKPNFKLIEMDENLILKNTMEGNISLAKSKLLNGAYVTNIEKIRLNLNNYYQQFSGISTEDAIVKAKLAAKQSKQVFERSLNTTFFIFFVAIVISILFSLIAAGAISDPINLLRSNIERMRRESLNIPLNRKLFLIKGEVGDLSRAFAELIDKLRSTTVLRNELLIEIEQRKKYEARLRETALRLQDSVDELDRFAYIASHDLKAPLRAIESLADWIKEDCYDILPVKSRENFDLIKKRAKRLEALINGILEYSRAGRVNTNYTTIDLNILIEEIIEDLSPPGNIKIIVDNALPFLFANKITMQQVFMNLISNAIKYNDKVIGLINIGSIDKDHYFKFYVSDNGPGIDKQFYQTIFSIFQTLQPRDIVESTGIGLSIVKKIVEKQKGKIWVESVVGKGSTFYFTWPKNEEQANL